MDAKKLRTIVVGTDFNELSTAALQFAAAIAESAGAELIVVYADTFEPPAEFTATQLHDVLDSIERSKVSAREQLDEYVRKHVREGVRWRAIVAEGLPATGISAIADREGADFIALGTHGRGGLQRLVIGSVAERVIRDAHVPVLTVRSTPPPSAVRRVLCPVSGSDMTPLAVGEAARIARAVGGELTLVDVGAPGSAPFDAKTLVPADVRTTVLPGGTAREDPAAEILALDRDGGYDLIVIGAEHRLVRDMTIVGTTAAHLTRHARSPVLTVVRAAVRPQPNEKEAAHAV